jgi:hypothetical protein
MKCLKKALARGAVPHMSRHKQARSRKQVAGKRSHTLKTRRLDRALSRDWAAGDEVVQLEIKDGKLDRARRLGRRRRGQGKQGDDCARPERLSKRFDFSRSA